jgi:hypothetical protein
MLHGIEYDWEQKENYYRTIIIRIQWNCLSEQGGN